MQEAGYLSDKRPEIIKHPYTKQLPMFLERKIEKITLQLTQDCNFRCKYCIYSEEANTKQRAHSKRHMSWETAKKAIDFYLDHSVDSLKRNVGLYGGEPLLQFDLMKRIIEYAEARLKGKPLSFNVTTNGSLLTDKIVEYLATHNVNILISLDGPKDINDKNRVFKNGEGTYDTVMRNIYRIKEEYPNYFNKLRINMVIDPSNDFDCVNSVTVEWKDISTSSLSTSFIDSTDEEIEFPDDFVTKVEYQGFLAFLSHFGCYPNERLSSIGMRQLLDTQTSIQMFSPSTEMPHETAPGGPCIPGKTRLFVNVDEQLFPCERVNESEIMCIGNLDDGFNIEKATELLNVGSLTVDECKNCWAMRHCTMCAKMADAGNSLSKETKRKNCSRVIGSAETKLRSMILMKEIPEYYKDLVRT